MRARGTVTPLLQQSCMTVSKSLASCPRTRHHRKTASSCAVPRDSALRHRMRACINTRLNKQPSRSAKLACSAILIGPLATLAVGALALALFSLAGGRRGQQRERRWLCQTRRRRVVDFHARPLASDSFAPSTVAWKMPPQSQTIPHRTSSDLRAIPSSRCRLPSCVPESIVRATLVGPSSSSLCSTRKPLNNYGNK